MRVRPSAKGATECQQARRLLTVGRWAVNFWLLTSKFTKVLTVNGRQLPRSVAGGMDLAWRAYDCGQTVVSTLPPVQPAPLPVAWITRFVTSDSTGQIRDSRPHIQEVGHGPTRLDNLDHVYPPSHLVFLLLRLHQLMLKKRDVSCASSTTNFRGHPRIALMR